MIAAFMTITLIGCNRNNEPKVVITEEITSETPSSEEAETQEPKAKDQPYWNVGLHDFCADDNGNYYYIDENDYCLMIFDAETKAARPVCEKEDCDHLEMDCTAYIDPFMYCMNSLYYYDGYLYMVSRYDRRYCLIRMNTDGSSRKNVTTLGYEEQTGYENIYNFAFCGEYIYYVERDFGTITGDEYSNVLFRQPLYNGDYEVVVGLGDYEEGVPARVKAYGNNVYYLIGDYNEKTGTPEYSGLYIYNTDIAQSSMIAEGDISDYAIDVSSQTMYVYTTRRGLYSISYGGEPVRITEASDDIPRQISWDGSYIYMSTYGNPSQETTEYIDIYSTDGELIRTVESDGWMTPEEVSYGDDRYMFATQDYTGIKVYVYYEKSDGIDNEAWSEIDNWFLANEEN